MTRIEFFCFLAALTLSASVIAAPGSNNPNPRGIANAAANATLTNVVSTAGGCSNLVTYNATLTVTGTTDDGGGNDTVFFSIYDDLVRTFQQSFAVPVGQTRSFTIAASYGGSVGGAIDGIGIFLSETNVDNGELIFIDPFQPTQVSCAVPTSSVGFAPLLALLLASVVGFRLVRRKK
jgi:hypothetical protein